MNSLLDGYDDDDDDRPSGQDRELTLSTGTILGIFVVLVLLCGAFFGFGYKMGSHRPSPIVQAAAPDTSISPSTNFSSFKPAAGSPVGNSTSVAPPPATAPASTKPPAQDAEADPPPAPRPTPATRPAPEPATPAASTPAAAGAFVVQVAAFTHQEDADLLVHALKVKGYPAFARSEPQDQLKHIQVGPFTNRKDAEAAKQRLLADGYQPILK
jgi:cell division septation protein DedD